MALLLIASPCCMRYDFLPTLGANNSGIFILDIIFGDIECRATCWTFDLPLVIDFMGCYSFSLCHNLLLIYRVGEEPLDPSPVRLNGDVVSDGSMCPGIVKAHKSHPHCRNEISITLSFHSLSSDLYGSAKAHSPHIPMHEY